MAGTVNANVSSSIYCRACGAANPPQSTHCHACGESLSIAMGSGGSATNPLTGLLPPDVIMYSRYRILAVLSTSEVSTVYKAEDTQLGNRLVQLKEIGKNNANTQEALALIEDSRREMLLLAGLVHPNLPRVYDYFVENSRWYFVMDFLEGDTLKDYLKQRKNRPLSAEEIVDSGIQLATVLEYLHMHKSSLGLQNLALETIWHTPDGKLYLLDTGTPPQADLMAQSSSIYNLGKILRQLQTRGKSIASLSRPTLPGRRNSRRMESLPLKKFVRQMTRKDLGKRPFPMSRVKSELQQLELQLLATPQTSLSKRKNRRLTRRGLLKAGGFAALATLTGGVTWLLGAQSVPHAFYSPGLGGTICTYYTDSAVLGVAWSPNGMRLVMGNTSAQVQAFDANTGLHVTNFSAPELSQRVEAVIWLPDGNTVAAGGDDNMAWVWNATTGKLQTTYRGHSNWVITLASSPDGRYIASGSEDMTVHVWEAATGQPVVIYRGHYSGIGSVAWSPDGAYIASASFDGSVQIWEAATGRPIYTYHGNAGAVYTVAWSPDGQRLASGDTSGTVEVWSVALFESDNPPQGPLVSYLQQNGPYNLSNNAIQAVTWSPDGKYIASASHDVEIWNSSTGKYLFTYAKHNTNTAKGVQAVAWSPNGRYIASGGMEGTVQVWNAR
ncbi:MAG TPA: protein kinase [Ktedonobacteraceae bacterium]|nr:protein kinase [Ktedonobacteraceae bacterium]